MPCGFHEGQLAFRTVNFQNKRQIGSLKQGKCEWATYPAPIGSDCFCTIR